jgi:hypothetical protein
MRRNAAPYEPLRVWFRPWLRLKRGKVVTLVTVPSRDGVDRGVGQKLGATPVLSRLAPPHHPLRLRCAPRGSLPAFARRRTHETEPHETNFIHQNNTMQ